MKMPGSGTIDLEDSILEGKVLIVISVSPGSIEDGSKILSLFRFSSSLPNRASLTPYAPSAIKPKIVLSSSSLS